MPTISKYWTITLNPILDSKNINFPHNPVFDNNKIVHNRKWSHVAIAISIGKLMYKWPTFIMYINW